ncbi:MAG: hypothetical protein LBC14_01870 [Desulfovibrio sp.]|jgi:hypothetical protein|nr:hypothetical protein [Desulfovibrio sp.]
MNTAPVCSRFTGKIPTGIACFLVLLFSVASCVPKDAAQQAAGPTDPNRKHLAYGVSLNLPSSWTVAGELAPDAASKAALDQRRRGGERIMIFGATAPPSTRGIESVAALFLLNEQRNFMPRDFAEKLPPAEFDRISAELFEQEKAAVKKSKSKLTLMELKLSPERVDGKFALLHRVLIADAKGVPLRSLRWDIYLPDGAGIAVRAECDPDNAAAEQDIRNIVNSLKIQ